MILKWVENEKVAVSVIIISLVLIVALQIFLCLKIKSKIIQFLPAIVLGFVTIMLAITAVMARPAANTFRVMIAVAVLVAVVGGIICRILWRLTHNFTAIVSVLTLLDFMAVMFSSQLFSHPDFYISSVYTLIMLLGSGTGWLVSRLVNY